MSIKEFAKMIGMTYQGVKYHIDQEQGFGRHFKKGVNNVYAISDEDAMKVLKEMNK